MQQDVRQAQPAPIRVLVLELVKEGLATQTKDIVLQVQALRRGVQPHSVRARLSEAVFRRELIRLKEGTYDLYHEEALNSVVDYPNRGPWGDASYRGNFSGFLVRDLYYQLRPASVLDVFEGGGTSRDVFLGLKAKKGIEVTYRGLDLRRGFNVLTDALEGTYDLILAHFPYHNIIRYSNHPDDLSACTSYPDFLQKVGKVMAKLHRALTEEGTLAVIIGDVRRNGAYYAIFHDIIAMEVGVLRSVIIKKQNNCRSSGTHYRRSKYLVPIAHEYVLLFSKT